MKTNCLHLRRVRRIALLALFLIAIGIEKSLALEFTIGQFQYTTNGSTTVKVRKAVYNLSGTVVIPATVTYNGVTYTVNEIAADGFYECTQVTSFSLPNTITTISARAFLGCTSLTGTLTIPNAVTIIGDNAYQGCSGFTELVMNNSLSIIGDGAFYQCSGLTGDLIFPSSVTKIGSTTFEACTGYHGVLVLPEGLSEISDNAFKDCHFTGDLIIPEGVSSIGNGAFMNCSSFTGDLIIPNSVIKILPNAFNNCTGFHGILMIQNNVKYIYGYALHNCNFSAIYCAAVNPPSTANTTFNGIGTNTPVYVPAASVSAYQSANNWRNFNHIYGAYFFVGNGNWSNGTNWIGESMPQNQGNTIVLANCNVNTSATVGSLLILKNKTVDVLSGNTLMVNNSLVNKGSYDNLVVEDGAQLKLYTTGVPAKVKKNIAAYSQAQNVNNGWNLISYPMANAGMIEMQENLTSNEYDLYYYDEPTHYWINQENSNGGYDQLIACRGYLYANSQNVSIGFTGELKKSSEEVVVPLDYTAGISIPGFNLVGNPFAHNINSYQGMNVVEYCYRMNQDGSDFIVSQVTADNPLKPAEGFFVKAISTNATITFNPQNLVKIPDPRYISFEVVENGKIADRLLVKRGQGNNLEKLSISNGTKLYAMEDAQKDAVIYCNSDAQPIAFKAAGNGLYTINFAVLGMDLDYLHLLDKITGMDIDLLTTSSYSFEASANDLSERFVLLFAPKPETGDDDAVLGCFAYVENDNILITDAEGGTLEVIDVLGHIIRSEAVFGNDRINLSSGVYVLRLINGNEVKIQKIVIR